MSDEIEKMVFAILILIAAASIGLLVAFPIMWCWNYAVVSTFSMPEITWGKAWCLYMVSKWLIKSSLFTQFKKQ